MKLRNFPRRQLNLRKSQRGFIINPYIFSTGGTPVGPVDPYFADVVLLANFQRGFADQSNYGRNVVITNPGSISVSTARSHYGPSSLLVASTGYMQWAGATSEMNLISQDLTLEAWIYPTAAPTSGANFLFQDDGTNGSQNFQWILNNALTITFNSFGTSARGSVFGVTSSNACTLNAWNHICVDKYTSGGTTTTRIYINGALGGTITNNYWAGTPRKLAFNNFTNDAANQSNGQARYVGYMDGLRITRQARYKGAFTPDNGPWIAPTDVNWPNVVLYAALNQSLLDESPNKKTLTAVGNAAITTAQAPYTNGGAAIFDGSGDAITIPSSTDFDMGTGDFTIEFFFRLNTLSGGRFFITRRNTSSPFAPFGLLVGAGGQLRMIFGTNPAGPYTIDQTGSTVITTGVWHHASLQRNGNTVSAYLDGGFEASGTTAAAMLTLNESVVIGAGDATGASCIDGCVAFTRITKGVALGAAVPTLPLPIGDPNDDPYFAARIFGLHMDGANLSTSFPDKSPTPKTFTANGGAKISTGQSKYGAASALFASGTSDYVSATSADFATGTGDFTVQGWMYVTSYTYCSIFSTYNSTTGVGIGLSLDNTGKPQFNIGNATSPSTADAVVGPTAIGLNLWVHLAAVRKNNVMTLYVNGVSVGTPLTTARSVDRTVAVIGRYYADVSSNYLNGNIDDTYMHGYAMYLANFTPPGAPFADYA